MRRFLLFGAMLLVTGAITLASSGGTRAGGPYEFVVDTDTGSPCETATTSVQPTVFGALAQDVQPGDTIFICPGTYVEKFLEVEDANVTITSANAATAILRLDATNMNGGIMQLQADGITVANLTFDGTKPPAYPHQVGGISSIQSGLTVTDNVFVNISGIAISLQLDPATNDNTVMRNEIGTSSYGIACVCNASEISDNSIQPEAGARIVALSVRGENLTVDGNSMTDASALFDGSGTISNNDFTGPGVLFTGQVQLTLHGTTISLTDNTFANNPVGAAVSISEGNTPPNVTILRNTFTSVLEGIQIFDDSDNGPTTTVAINGGSAGDANIFINPGESSLLVRLEGAVPNINAENNKWGLCTAEEIAEKIMDGADDGGSPVALGTTVGIVDFDPFLKPNGCPAVTPSPSPSPTPSPDRLWGDIDCSGILEALDALKLLLGFLVLPYDSPPSCPGVLEDVTISGTQDWGDIDCSGGVDASDASYVLARAAGTPRTPPPDCPAVGDAVTVDAG
jgi:hypothetical protein